MPLGPGHYDDLCTEVRVKTDAHGVLLIVFGGNRGEGFSAQILPHLMPHVPAILRRVADEIDASFKDARPS